MSGLKMLDMRYDMDIATNYHIFVQWLLSLKFGWISLSPDLPPAAQPSPATIRNMELVRRV